MIAGKGKGMGVREKGVGGVMRLEIFLPLLIKRNFMIAKAWFFFNQAVFFFFLGGIPV